MFSLKAYIIIYYFSPLTKSLPHSLSSPGFCESPPGCGLYTPSPASRPSLTLLISGRSMRPARVPSCCPREQRSHWWPRRVYNPGGQSEDGVRRVDSVCGRDAGWKSVAGRGLGNREKETDGCGGCGVGGTRGVTGKQVNRSARKGSAENQWTSEGGITMCFSPSEGNSCDLAETFGWED